MNLTTTTVAVPDSKELQELILEEKEQECNVRIKNEQKVATYTNGSCPPIWDGIMCWDRARAGQLVVQPCSAYLRGFNPEETASKLCTTEGKWFVQNGNVWTNFTRCFEKMTTTLICDVDHFDDAFIKDHLPTLKVISTVGYTVSLISLFVAFVILISFKRLRCPRNVLHMHLFASFIGRASIVLLKVSLIENGMSISTNLDKQYFYSEQQSTWVCKLFVSLWQYCIQANYSWILMEGLYLYNLIFQALFADSSSITLYIILGWGLPVIFVVPWTICRAFLENTLCWTTHDHTIVYLLIRGPISSIVVVNFVLFVAIVRVLLRKLKSSVCEETQKYRRWAKSTLVLIPLFGVHYSIFFCLQFSPRNTDELVWLYCDQSFTSFNGFFVALLYCFLNGEVRSELGRKWNRFSFEAVLERCDNNIFSCGFSRSRRHYRPRGSCYSSTSCTADSVVHGCSTDRKRLHTTLKGSTPVTRLNREERKDLTDEKYTLDNELENCTQIEDKLSNSGKDRRWSSSDCNSENNALELKSMTSQHDIVNL